MADREEWGSGHFEEEWLTDGFVTLPKVVVFDTRISGGAKATYGAVCWYIWKHGKVPPQTELADELGGGVRTIKRHLAELEDAGYIERLQLGLGRPNEYIIKALPRGPKMALQGGHKRHFKRAKSGPPSRVVESSEVTTENLSHTVSDAFFAAIGEQRPAKRRRERCVSTVNDLLAEGFSEDAIREACRLAGERGARGPELLPHLVGEAVARLEKRASSSARQRAVAAAAATPAVDVDADLAAVALLPVSERERLERECRERLPEDLSKAMAERVLPGMIAARLRSG